MEHRITETFETKKKRERSSGLTNQRSWGLGGNKWVKNTRYLLILLACEPVPSIILPDPGHSAIGTAILITFGVIFFCDNIISSGCSELLLAFRAAGVRTSIGVRNYSGEEQGSNGTEFEVGTV